ncbi:hypothetical protein FRAHR75_60119 [Frankia sp. Hr75.2]|nr:hypothetical protein FRAHR75_60119 [Frankia sp. Hr75.2]
MKLVSVTSFTLTHNARTVNQQGQLR